MPVQSAAVKAAKTARGRRVLQKREPKLIENARNTLIARGQKTSALVNAALTDLYMLKKPHSVHFKRHNAVHPFEDAAPLEFLCQKNDASLFAFGTHSKKRPNNLVLGRMFDHHVLDMVELGISAYEPMGSFPGAGGGSTSGAKPCLLFSGADWSHTAELQHLRGLLVDFFNLEVVESISPLGIDHFLCFTAVGGKVLIRHYLARLLKSAEGTSPHVSLIEMGPSLDLSIRRTHYASDELMAAAMTRPKVSAQAPKKIKNVTRSKLLGKQGQLRLPRQDLSKMATARMKGLKEPKRERPEGSTEPAERDAQVLGMRLKKRQKMNH
jgi:ribosome production factor 2